MKVIETAFSQLTSAQVVDRLDKAGIATASVNTVDQLWAHPQLEARQRWRGIDSPAGTIPALLPPGRNDAYDYRMDAVPAIGEHTEAILGELGYAAAEIVRLKEQGTI